jgi:hypothetical protein
MQAKFDRARRVAAVEQKRRKTEPGLQDKRDAE